MAGDTLVIAIIIVFGIFCSTEQTIVEENCPGQDDFIRELDVAASDVHLLDPSGTQCRDEEWHRDTSNSNKTAVCTSCNVVYQVCSSVILLLQLTTPKCLNSTNSTNTSNINDNTSVSPSQAYGYGFIMVMIVSGLSLLGIFIVPFINGHFCIGQKIYKHVMTLLIAMGASALLCDALFELFPTIFHIDYQHEYTAIEKRNQIWKSCAVISGILAFYLFERILHCLIHTTDVKPKTSVHSTSTMDKMNETNVLIRHRTYEDTFCQKVFSLKKVRPLAWIILAGDLLHNFADGITLGASISQSLTLGMSTAFAIILHEIPHELADFGILVNSGMYWCTALLFNFLSSLMAILGFFTGVAVSTSSHVAKEWLLAIAAGSFLYIALADLLPELQNETIHSHHKDHSTEESNKNHSTEESTQSVHVNSCCDKLVHFFLILIGFLISFILLLVLSLHEEDLNKLFN